MTTGREGARVGLWVPDPRRHDVKRPRVERGSVHSSIHDSDYDHDDMPPRVVKTISRDSGNTQSGAELGLGPVVPWP
jgi:hypothetical protein